MEDIFEIKDIALNLEANYTVTNRDIQLSLKFVNNFLKKIDFKQLLVIMSMAVKLYVTLGHVTLNVKLFRFMHKAGIAKGA